MSRMSATPAAQAAEDRRAAWHRTVDDISGWLFYASIFVALISVGYLIYAIIGFSSGGGTYTASDLDRLHHGIELVGQVFLGATIGVIITTAWLFYEQEVLGYLYLLAGLLVYWGIPIILDAFIGPPRGVEASKRLSGLALQQIQVTTWGFLIAAGIFILADLLIRLARRIRFGAKSDQLKYGVGIEEVADIRPRFLGKCWQLPYCRKFVRIKCPIFHSRRTCWRERVGCMCEESVIQNIGVDQHFSKVASENVRLIPYNNKLPMWVKKERCRNCVIYNEHQRQKYKLVAPLAVGSLVGLAYYFHAELMSVMLAMLDRVDRFMMKLSITPSSQTRQHETLANLLQSTGYVGEIILVCFFVIAMAYLLKLVEFLIFRVKI